MKNRLKNSLLIIIGIICILPIGIKAEINVKTSCRSLSNTTTRGVANIPGVHTGNYVEMSMSINGINYPALCLEPGKKASTRFKYGTSTTGGGDRIGQALNYANIKKSMYAQFAAQIVAWMPGASEQDIIAAINKVYRDNNITIDATATFNEIKMTASIPYCIYESSGNVQKVAVPKVGDCNIKCNTKIENRCPKYDIMETGDCPTCDEKASKNTPARYYETSYRMSDSGGENAINQYGRLVASPNKYCRIYCLEDVNITVPGAPNEVDIGQATLTWPTSKNSNNNNEGANKYPLIFKGSKTCHIYVSSDQQSCSYEPFTQKYSNNRQVVISKRNVNVTPCSSVGAWDSESCSKYSISHEDLRQFGCSGGNHNGSISCGEEYYKSAYYYDTVQSNLTKATEETTKAKTALDTCHTSCVGSSKGNGNCADHPNMCAGATTGTYPLGTYDESSCDAEGGPCGSQKATYDKYKGYEDYWSGIKTIYDNDISSINSYISNYWNAEQILDALYECEHYDFRSNIDKFYSSFQSGATAYLNNDEYKLVTKDNAVENAKCESGCDATGYFTKSKNEISKVGDLIPADELKQKIGIGGDVGIASSGLMAREIKITTGEINYQLPENKSYYYITADGVLVKSLDDVEKSGYKKLEVPNMILGKTMQEINATKNYSVSLKLADKFGSNGQFKWTCPYVCSFNLKTPDACLCPPETNYSGLNLEYIQKAEGLTCADAQTKYCQKTNIDDIACPDGTHKEEVEECIDDKGGYTKDIYNACVSQYCSNRYACPDGSKADEMTQCINDNGGYIDGYLGCYQNNCVCKNCYCDEGPNPDKVITSCVARYTKVYGEEKAAKYCRRKMCHNYECPGNTPNAYMDISDCVELYLKNAGTSFADDDYTSKLEDAKEACVNAVCPAKGIKIIYRTIKLENPFPSYDADSTTIKNLKKKTFNLDLSGRYPGSNWNGRILVYNEIINNRSDRHFSNEESINNTQSFIGSTLYQTKEPLYTFDLTPAIINQIRRYNDEQQRGNKGGYSDFTLTCKKNSSAACISDFIWGRTSAGNVGLDTSNSKCTNRTQDFYSCTNG